MRVDELTGTTIGRYRVSGRLQALPYATVHRANVVADQRPVLLWIFNESYSRAMGFLEALQRLAADRRLEGVPGVAQVLEIGSQDAPSPISYLVSEDAGGGFLVSLLQAGRAPGVIATTAALAPAIDGLHQRGLVHGDVQPATIAVDSAGRPMLVGYAVRSVVSRVTPQAEWLGMTRGFRPPELRQILEPRPASDLYGLAALVYYLLVGRPPSPDHPPEAPSRLRPQLPVGMDRVLLRALAPDPAQRPRSAAEFLTELRGTMARPAAPSRAHPMSGDAPAGDRGGQGSGPATRGTVPRAERPGGSSEAEGASASKPSSPWLTAKAVEPARPTSTLVSLVPLEPYEMEPEIRRRSGVVLLLALTVVAAVLLVLAALGRLTL